MELYIITAIVVVIIGAVYWFWIRDDGAWDKDTTKLKLAPVDYGSLNKGREADGAVLPCFALASRMLHWFFRHSP